MVKVSTLEIENYALIWCDQILNDLVKSKKTRNIHLISLKECLRGYLFHLITSPTTLKMWKKKKLEGYYKEMKFFLENEVKESVKSKIHYEKILK